MGRPPLRNTGNATKVQTAVSSDRRHIVRDLSEVTGLGKPTVHRVLKIRLENVKGICKMGFLFIIGR